MTDDELQTAARYCLAIAGTNPALAADYRSPCEALPILFPAGGDAYGAALNDAYAIAGHPTWVRLHYMSEAEKKATDLPKGWYNSEKYLPQPTACTGQTGGTTGYRCDEYPLYASVESGPGARLQPVPESENLAEGTAYRAMLNRCGLTSQTADGSVVGSPFLVIPIPLRPGPLSFYVCSVK
jgi:Deoxyribonuclease NucA/NucB